MRKVMVSRLLVVITVVGLAPFLGAQPPLAPLVQQNSRNELLVGRVTAISKESISIQAVDVQFKWVDHFQNEPTQATLYGKPLWFEMPSQIIKASKVVIRPGRQREYVITGIDGTVTVIREKDQAIRTFKFAEDLAAGRYSTGLSAADSYRSQDVKVGDRVRICYDRIDWIEFCKSICIGWRPRGLVPPSPNDADQVPGVKYHEWANAQNEWLDHGTPMPDKFLSPVELAERRERIAPMPREAVPRIPEAKP